MPSSAYYIDQCRKHTDTGTNYAVAKLLGISHDAVAQYEKGTRVMDNRTAIRVSEVLRVPLERIIRELEQDRVRRSSLAAGVFVHRRA